MNIQCVGFCLHNIVMLYRNYSMFTSSSLDFRFTFFTGTMQNMTLCRKTQKQFVVQSYFMTYFCRLSLNTVSGVK